METKTETKQEQALETKQEQRAIATRKPLEFMPANLDDAWRMAEMFSKAGIVPDTLRGKPYDMLVTIVTGLEFGVSPMVAMRELYVVKGKASMSALLKQALVKNSPQCEYFRLVESTPEKATFETKRKGEGITRISFTIQEAEQAQLTSGENWKKYPALMLRRRCASQLADEVYSDVTRGAGLDDDLSPEDRGGGSRLGATTAAPPPAPRNLQVVSSRVNPPPVETTLAQDPDDLGMPPPGTPPESQAKEAAPPAREREPGSDDGDEAPPASAKDPVDELLAAMNAAKTEAELDKLVVSAKTIQGPRRQEVGARMNARRKELRGG